MQVARLQPSDAWRYRELMLEAYRLAADAFTSSAEERAAEPESFWVQRIADSTGASAAFGAFDGEELIGTVALEFSTKLKTKHKALLIGMYVTPTRRGRKIGRALLEAALAHASTRQGIRLLTLTATEGNEAAIRLYRAAGFEVFGIEPMAILTPGGYKAKVHMGLPLSPADADASDRRFVHSRLIDATPEQVFRAFSQPERLARWWGPEGFSSTFEAFDLRPGGSWRFVMHGPDGTDYPNANVFKAVEPPSRVEVEHVCEDHHFVLRITLAGQGSQTLVGWEQTFDTAEHKQLVARWVGPANEQNLDRLQREVAGVNESGAA